VSGSRDAALPRGWARRGTGSGSATRPGVSRPGTGLRAVQLKALDSEELGELACQVVLELARRGDDSPRSFCEALFTGMPDDETWRALERAGVT
jgi:hypothetical protein